MNLYSAIIEDTKNDKAIDILICATSLPAALTKIGMINEYYEVIAILKVGNTNQSI